MGNSIDFSKIEPIVRDKTFLPQYIKDNDSIDTIIRKTILTKEFSQIITKIKNKDSIYSLEKDFWKLSFQDVMYHYFFNFLTTIDVMIPDEVINEMLEINERNGGNYTKKQVENSLKEFIYSEEYVPVKLYISAPSDKLNLFQKVVAKHFSEFGIVQIGLQIGPYL